MTRRYLSSALILFAAYLLAQVALAFVVGRFPIRP